MKLIGYAPDADKTVEGVIVDCTAFVPDEKGYTGAPKAESAGVSPLPSACYGGAVLTNLDGTFRVFAGTSDAIYELNSATWDNVSSGTYTLNADDFWRFTQFADTALAVNKNTGLQESLSGAFSEVSGAPKADIIETVGNQVFLFNTNDDTYGDSPNRWWCSAVRDHTDWTPNIETQSATNTLTSTSGRIAAAKRFGNQIVVYKERSMYIGTYVGSPVIWDFQEIAGDVGVSSNEAVVNIGTADSPTHIFMGKDDFWRFDGSRPIPIGSPLRKTVYGELYTKFAYRIKSLHDRINQRVYFYYPSQSGGGILDRCVVYHYRQNKWGRDDRRIDAAFQITSGGSTYDTLDTVSPTYNEFPNSLTYDSPFWISGNEAPAIVVDGEVFTITGHTENSSFSLNDMGNDFQYFLLKRVKPVWLSKPSTAAMTNCYKYSEGDALIEDATTTMVESRFDVLRSARWHSLKFDMTGNYSLNEVNVIMEPEGDE